MLFKEYTQEEHDSALVEGKARDMVISLAQDNVEMDFIARAAKVPVETVNFIDEKDAQNLLEVYKYEWYDS